MYEEDTIKINWVKLFLKLFIAFIIVIISVKLLSIIINKQHINKVDNVMNKNLIYIDEFARDYFKGDKLPSKNTESITVNLEVFIKSGKLKAIKDHNDEMCDFNNSYIKATKLDTEYQIKSFLVCGDKSDYINSFVKIDDNITIKPSLTTTKVKSTTKVKKRIISFNSNGGSYVANIVIDNGKKAKSPISPEREGYKFVGWYYHGKPFNFNKTITKDYVLTAKWVKEN